MLQVQNPVKYVVLLTASAKLRADRRRWLQKYATDPMVLEFGVDGKPFFSASAAETLLKKTIEHGRSAYTRSLSTLEFPVPVDSLWKYLGDCRLADQAVKKIPDAPKQSNSGRHTWLHYPDHVS